PGTTRPGRRAGARGSGRGVRPRQRGRAAGSPPRPGATRSARGGPATTRPPRRPVRRGGGRATRAATGAGAASAGGATANRPAGPRRGGPRRGPGRPGWEGSTTRQGHGFRSMLLVFSPFSTLKVSPDVSGLEYLSGIRTTVGGTSPMMEMLLPGLFGSTDFVPLAASPAPANGLVPAPGGPCGGAGTVTVTVHSPIGSALQ